MDSTYLSHPQIDNNFKTQFNLLRVLKKKNQSDQPISEKRRTKCSREKNNSKKHITPIQTPRLAFHINKRRKPASTNDGKQTIDYIIYVAAQPLTSKNSDAIER